MQRLGRSRGTSAGLILLGIALLIMPACRRQRALEEVQGMVVDSAGKPLATVRVFNSGDGPEPIETTTDAAGRFRLTGIEPGPIYVFAEKAEYRFAGVRTTAGASDVIIKMSQQSEPPPSRPVALEPMSLEQQKKLARRLLEKLWAKEARSKRCYKVPLAMSRINPELALRWSTESDPGCADLIHSSMAEKLADGDLDDALSTIDQSGTRGLILLAKLARRYTASDPTKSMRCAEELLVGARAIDQPWRTGYLAEAGSILIRLGKKEAGWKLLDGAGEMAAKLGSEHAQGGVRAMVAISMAPSDLKRALDLLKPISVENNQPRP